MRRDADIIGYMYNDTEQKIREQIAKEIELVAMATHEKSYPDAVGAFRMAIDIARGKK
jgi:hypothetical protein